MISWCSIRWTYYSVRAVCYVGYVRLYNIYIDNRTYTLIKQHIHYVLYVTYVIWNLGAVYVGLLILSARYVMWDMFDNTTCTLIIEHIHHVLYVTYYSVRAVCYVMWDVFDNRTYTLIIQHMHYVLYVTYVIWYPGIVYVGLIILSARYIVCCHRKYIIYTICCILHISYDIFGLGHCFPAVCYTSHILPNTFYSKRTHSIVREHILYVTYHILV